MQTLDELKVTIEKHKPIGKKEIGTRSVRFWKAMGNKEAELKRTGELWDALSDAIQRIEALREFATHKPGCYESGNECICELDDLLAETQEGKS